MINSMTGFAACSRELPHGSIHVELRTVNSRFLDLYFRIPDDFRAAEPGLRELLSARLSRGKVECRVNFQASTATATTKEPRPEALAALAALETRVRHALPAAAPLSVAEVLRWPGIFGDESVDPQVQLAACLDAARQAVEELQASRAREGAKLAEMIRERLAAIRAVVARVAPHIPAAQAAYEEKLRQRLQEAAGQVDDERIRQEVVLFATRIDVAEELSRLTTHVAEVERVLATGGVAGKRLDFLMQELNREANTLGSKSVVQDVSSAAMELKLYIEQMREQIQNIE